MPRLLAILATRETQNAAAQFTTSQVWRLSLAPGVEEGRALLQRDKGLQIVLLDRDLAAEDWRPVVRDLSRTSANPSVILASSVVDHYLFDEVVRQGGFDVVSKPLKAEELRRTALLALKFRKQSFGAPRGESR